MKDQGVVRFRLPRWSEVTLTIHRAYRNGPALRTVELGRLSRGHHTWAWDGRDDQGRKLRPRTYRVTLSGSRINGDSDHIVVDTDFSPTISAPTYGAPVGRAPAVHPRTTVVRDSLPITATKPTYKEGVRRLALVIRDRGGRVVLRHTVGKIEPTWAPSWFTHRWTARADGKPLAPGRYTAVLAGVDLAGNSGRSEPLRLWVSRDALTWQQRAYAVGAASSRVDDVCDFFRWGTSCGEGPHPCGDTAPSAFYADGLSYRSRECASTSYPGGYAAATALHQLPFPQTAGVRGVAEAKVAFAGRPTHAGESDQGTISVRSSDQAAPAAHASGSTSAETPWADCQGCHGWRDYDENPLAPRVIWWFGTTGTDSVDVDLFTVTVRYLGVEG